MTSPDPIDDRNATEAARVAEAAGRWRRRSRRVMLFRRVLPIAIVVLAGGAVLWVAGRSVVSGIQKREDQANEIRLANPMFHGQDDHGRAFVIGARQAVRDPATGQFRLDGPVVRLTLEAGRRTELTAGHGLYDQTARTVTLRDQVRIADGGAGMTFVTPEAVVDTTTGVVTGERGITGSGRMGAIDATSYAIYEQGGRIVFRGSADRKVTATLNPSQD